MSASRSSVWKIPCARVAQEWDGTAIRFLACALCAVAVAAPRELQLSVHFADPGRAPVWQDSHLATLQDRLGGLEGSSVLLEGLEALRTLLEGWRPGMAAAPGQGGLMTRLQAAGSVVLSEASARCLLDAMPLPTPHALQLPGCANPACGNVDGGSEAGLPLKACARCGAVAYCSRECQLQAWRSGHKDACAQMKAAADRGGIP